MNVKEAESMIVMQTLDVKILLALIHVAATEDIMVLEHLVWVSFSVVVVNLR